MRCVILEKGDLSIKLCLDTSIRACDELVKSGWKIKEYINGTT